MTGRGHPRGSLCRQTATYLLYERRIYRRARQLVADENLITHLNFMTVEWSKRNFNSGNDGTTASLGAFYAFWMRRIRLGIDRHGFYTFFVTVPIDRDNQFEN